MGNLKYKEGDKVGPYQTKLIKRYYKSPKADFQCSFCGKFFSAQISNIVSGKTISCGCQYKINYYKDGDRIGPYNILLIKRLYKNKNKHWVGLFECPYCGEEFENTLGHIASGHTQSCGCVSFDLSGKKAREYDVGDRIGPFDIKILKRTRGSGKATFECPICKKPFDSYFSTVLTGSVRSCGCFYLSRGEEKIKNILNDMKISFVHQKQFENCKVKRCLKFDFYLPEYNCCIEYNGEQHYFPVEAFGGEEQLKKQRQYDQIKIDYCKNNNIKLIEIPYTDYKKLNKEYLQERIANEHSIS